MLGYDIYTNGRITGTPQIDYRKVKVLCSNQDIFYPNRLIVFDNVFQTNYYEIYKKLPVMSKRDVQIEDMTNGFKASRLMLQSFRL